MLTFDRYGQGLTTARDPLDDSHGYGHDFSDAAQDLHEIITTVAALHFNLTKSEVENGSLALLFVGNSIGVPIIRLYSQAHPGLVSGAIFLDSNIANVNYTDFIPDPDSPDFDPEFALGKDCSLEQYREARRKLGALFDLHVKNKECLDRRNGPTLLPHTDRPKLVGPGGNLGSWITVVGHDPIFFAEVSEQHMGTPKSMSMKFINPYWAEYNRELTKITDEGRCGGVKIAKGCGHFIQSDGPDFVAGEVMSLMQKQGW